MRRTNSRVERQLLPDLMIKFSSRRQTPTEVHVCDQQTQLNRRQVSISPIGPLNVVFEAANEGKQRVSYASHRRSSMFANAWKQTSGRDATPRLGLFCLVQHGLKDAMTRGHKNDCCFARDVVCADDDHVRFGICSDADPTGPLNQVGRFVVSAPMCEKLGMKLDPDLPTKAEEALKVETASWPVEPATVERLKGEAVTRQGRILGTDLQAAADGAKSDAQLRAVTGILLGYGRTCLAATTGPIFSSLIVPPPGYDLHEATTETADRMLEAGELASWQTSQIQARGDMMMLADTCRSKIGPARSDALVEEFGQSNDLRVRNYYTKSFDEGLADPTMIETLAGCNKAITSDRAKLR